MSKVRLKISIDSETVRSSVVNRFRLYFEFYANETLSFEEIRELYRFSSGTLYRSASTPLGYDFPLSNTALIDDNIASGRLNRDSVKNCYCDLGSVAIQNVDRFGDTVWLDDRVERIARYCLALSEKGYIDEHPASFFNSAFQVTHLRDGYSRKLFKKAQVERFILAAFEAYAGKDVKVKKFVTSVIS